MTVLFSEQEIARRVAALGHKITKDYARKNLVVLVLLDGAFIFAADLCRSIFCSKQIFFVKVSSYGHGTESSGTLHVHLDIAGEKIRGKDVLVVDDICDSGLTISKVLSSLMDKGARTVRSCVLLDKTARRKNAVLVNYFGFSCPDAFVVGYGMDYQGDFRAGRDVRIVEY